MDVIDPPPANTSDSEFLDAESEGEYFVGDDQEAEDQKHSIIYELREELSVNRAESTHLHEAGGDESDLPKSESFCSDKSREFSESSESLQASTSASATATTTTARTTAATTSPSAATRPARSKGACEYMQNSLWRRQKKHIFILSEAGKPIYSLHGNEDKLAALFGIIQALVSFVQHGQDAITSIHAHGIKFVFLVRNSLILVAASRTQMSVQQLQMQLSDVYNQILSTLTYSQMTKIFEKRKNFDLRRLLAGSERLIYHLLSNDSTEERITNNVFTFLTNSIRVLPLPSTVRSNIVAAIQSNCSKIKNLVFAVLIADNKLITLVRMKKYSIHPADLRLIFNLVECTESFKSSECWPPICLPKFDMNGYLYAHVSYLADDCQACLLLLSVDRDVFFTLSEAKKRITEKLRRTHCLEAISAEMNKGIDERMNLAAMGLSELRHFLYKPRTTAQLLCSELTPPYTTLKDFERLEGIYCELLQRIHNSARPLKLIYEVREREVMLAWVTAAYELYAVFEPMVNKSHVIKHVDKLIKWIEKEHDVYFIRNHPTF